MIEFFDPVIYDPFRIGNVPSYLHASVRDDFYLPFSQIIIKIRYSTS
jgi:hypothetical protein